MVHTSFTRRGSALFLAAAILISTFLSIFLLCTDISAKSLEKIDVNQAKAIYLYNIENDYLLLSKNADEKLQPVSTVKIMAGLIACEALSDRLDEVVVITNAMVDGVIGQQYNIMPGHNLSVRDLLYLAFCGGCHKSISALAHLISGNVTNFIALMNAKAADLGMNNTYYANATGMHNDAMYTTVNDIAKLSLAASKNPLLMQITTADAYTTEKLGEKNFTFENRNYLVGTGYTALYYDSIFHGLAAGSTIESGYCVSTIADNGELSYLCIIMGAGTDEGGNIQSYILANELVDWAYSSWGYVEVISTDTAVCEMPVTMSLDIDSVLIVPAESFSVYLPTATVIGEDVTYSYSLNAEELQAPISQGAQVGLITAYYGDRAIATVPLVTKSSIAQSEVLYTLEKIKEISQSRIFIASVICALVFTVVYIIIKSIIRGSASAKRQRYRRQR